MYISNWHAWYVPWAEFRIIFPKSHISSFLVRVNESIPGSSGNAICGRSRKALFKDLDGSALGLDSPVSVFQKSELDWEQVCQDAGKLLVKGRQQYRRILYVRDRDLEGIQCYCGHLKTIIPGYILGVFIPERWQYDNKEFRVIVSGVQFPIVYVSPSSRASNLIQHNLYMY